MTLITTRFLFVLTIFLSAVIQCFVAKPSARAAGAEAVTINTNLTVFTPPVRLERPAREARASVVLMEGGNGLLSLDATGAISINGNFLIRSANLFLRNGLNVMMPDAAPAHPGGYVLYRDLLDATHAAELQGFINTAVSRWGKPVWVVGTSAGSVSAVTAGGFQPALTGLRGVVITSPPTILPPFNQATFNLYVSRITLPALVVWHQNDHCPVVPPAGSAALFAMIPSNSKASASFQGGHSVAVDPCGPFSEHGYAGIEEEVVETIADFIIRGRDRD